MYKVSGILERLIKQYGLEGKMAEYVIAEKWEDIVGKIIASHTRPVGIRHRRLQVLVDSPAWLQEISFYRRELIERVNRYMGKKIINQVYLRTGQLEDVTGDE